MPLKSIQKSLSMTNNERERSTHLQGSPSVPMRIMEIREIKFPVKLARSQDVLDVVNDLRLADRETFTVLHLSSANVIINREVVSVGTINSAAVYPREVLKSCILNNASSVILVHNHPSGDCKPSESDRRITRELIAALLLCQIVVLDHIIISVSGSFSFADAGLLGIMTNHAEDVLKQLDLDKGTS